MPDTLAQKVRAKFPGAYDDLSDQELEAKVSAKFPGVYDDIPKTAAAKEPFNPPRIAEPSLRDRAVGAMLPILPVEVGKGIVKGAARSVLYAGELIRNARGVTSDDDKINGKPLLSDEAIEQAHTQLQYQNPQQMLGGGIETAAEFALPITKAAKAIPSTSRAGRAFQEVMSAAKNVPVDINAPGQVALRIHQLAERGGSMPMAVRRFLNRVTDPEKGAFVYEEARDFASNISRLSANEYQRLTPVVAREVANLRVTLNKAVAQAANKAGKGKEYAQAMNEYARAMKVRNAIDDAVKAAKKSLPTATIAGAAGAAGYWVTQKLRGLLGD